MSQTKTFSWTNPATAVAKNLSTGFKVAKITTVDITTGGSFQWMDTMATAAYLDVDGGTITTTNGFTPLAQKSIIGAAITNFTTANPGVITASNIEEIGVVAGDTIAVVGLADDQSLITKNGTFTVASVTATTITLNESTVGYSVYVSGGLVIRVSDSAGNAVPTCNVSVRGIIAGVDVVGANNAVMVAVVESSESVV